MCQLLAMSFNEPISPSISFRGFRHRGKDNPHGWGIAFYPEEAVQVLKEPIKAPASPLSHFLQDYPAIKSRTIISHVRYASKGDIAYKNTHPFSRECEGKDYTFAHNGTLHNYQNMLPLDSFRAVGDTDSEWAFCHLLSLIRNRGILEWELGDYEWLHNQFRRIND